MSKATDAMLLVTMPWSPISYPSMPLGALKSALDRAGIPAAVHYFNLDWAESLAASALPGGAVASLSDYFAIAVHHTRSGIGEWVFAVPPFREEVSADDELFLSGLADHGLPTGLISKVKGMRQLAPDFLSRCADKVLELSPRIVGFTTGYSQTVPALSLARVLKERAPWLSIVLGGIDCSGIMGEALLRSFPWVDVVVRGEGEPVLAEVGRALLAEREPEPLPGLCYRRGDEAVVIDCGTARTRMDDLAIPDHREYFRRLSASPLGGMLLPLVEIPVESSRGCWWGEKSHCTFCAFEETALPFRKKSAARVLDELLTLARRHRRLQFAFADTIMAMDYFRDLLPAVRDLGIDLEIFAETRAHLKKHQVALLADSGFSGIEVGLESLSTPILKLMAKGTTALQNIRLLKWCRELGVSLPWNLIYGAPREPVEEYARMADTISALTHLQPPTLIPLALDRFSPYHDSPTEHGIEILGPPSWYPLVYPRDGRVRARLEDLSYRFRYRYLDGRDPESYVGPVRDAVEAWHEVWDESRCTLRYLRGPGFLTLIDDRPNLQPARYTLDGPDAAIYLACDAGATPEEVAKRLQSEPHAPSLTGKEVRERLDELVEHRLVYRENDHYLSLAVAERAKARGNDAEQTSAFTYARDVGQDVVVV